MDQWAESQNLNIIHDAKLPKLFKSGRWKKDNNPDLAFVSSDIAKLYNKLVLQFIARTQNHPIDFKINAALTPKTVAFQRCFNYTKQAGKSFQTNLNTTL